MLSHMRGWLEPPRFEADEEKTALARVVNTLMINLGIVLLVAAGVLVPLFAAQKIGSWILLGVLFGVLLAGRALMARGQMQLSLGVLISASWLAFLALALFSGGSTSPAMFYLAAVTLVAGFVLRPPIANGLTALTILVALGITFAQSRGLVLPIIFVFRPVFSWLAFGLGLAFMAAARNLFTRELQHALAAARQQNAARRQAEASLRASEARFKAQYLGAPIPANSWRFTGDDLILVDFNDAALAFSHGQIAALVGQPASILLARQPEILQEMLTCARTQAAVHSEGWRRLGAGVELQYVAMHYAFIPPERVMTYVIDITERQQAQEAVRESEEKYRGLVQGSTDAIAIYRAGRLVFANSASAQLLRAASVEQLLGLAIIDLVHPDYRAFVAERMRLAREDGQPLAFAEEKFICFDGSAVDVEVKAIPCTFEKQPAVQVIARDITERKRAEAALRASETLNQKILATSPNLVYIYDLDRQTEVFANRTLASVLGYPAGQAHLAGSVFLPAEVHPEDAHILSEKLAWVGTVQDGEIVGREYRVRHVDGLWRWIGTREMVFRRAPDGRPDQIMGVAQEITKRMRAEEEIARTALMLDIAPNAITVHDFEGRFLYANQRTFDLHGYSREEFMALDLARLDVPESAEWIGPRLRELRERGEANFEVEHRRKDGSRLPMDVRARLTIWGDAPAVLSIATDISERRRAEQSLHESETRFRALVQTAHDAIISMDARGRIVSWNAAAEAIFGYSSAEALDMPISRIAPEEFRARQQRGLEQAAAGAERQIAGRTIEAAGLAKDGREFPIEMSLAEWQTQSGYFHTAIIRDVSERKQREYELRAIAQLSAALRAAPSPAEMLPLIVDQLGRLLKCEASAAELIDPLTGDAVVRAAAGAWASVTGFRQAAGTGLDEIIRQTRQPYLDNHLRDNPHMGIPPEVMNGIVAGAGVPLIAHDQLLGYLWMGRARKISESELRLLVAVADIAANALRRASLHERTQKNAAELARAYDTTLEGWARALELRDQETEGHTRRVTQLMVRLARALGVAEAELENVRRGALLHDIGKMGIPDSVLLKPGTLNEREWEIMRRHPEYACQLLEPIEYLRPVLDIPHYHHEKWDGSGYPVGLKGADIPRVARMFAVVDVWDALTSDRPYRAAWPREKVLEHIRQQSGQHFDPEIVEAFLQIV